MGMGTAQSFLSRTQVEKLQEIMEPKFGLLAKLLIGDSISLDEKEKIDARQSTYDKNKMLFRIIRGRGKLIELRDALEESDQIHVVKWIEGNGEYSDMFGLDWPLTSRENYSIAGSYELLCDILDAEFSGFVETLRSKSVLNKRHIELIKSKATNYERVQTFLDILRRFSLKTYFLMIRRLQKSNHSHIAIILENVIVPVHIHLEEQNADELEKQLVREVVKLCLENKASTAGQADVCSSLAYLRMNIIAAKRGESIVLYVRCSDTKEFHQLCTMVDNDEMSQLLEKMFQSLFRNIQTNILTITILETDRKRAEKAFRCESLRDKMLDEHLRRLRSQLNNDETMEIPAVEGIKEEEQKKLENEKEKHTTCIRRWYSKLLSSLTMIPEIVAEMYEKEKISDSELERLQSYQDTPVRASKELLGLLITNSVEVYESFLESLRFTKQDHLYLLLTSSSDEFETDPNTISEHSVVIRRNYSFLIETLGFVSNLLEFLFQHEVLSLREYEQISTERDRFRKSEILLSLISRKSDKDFTLFKEALRDANLGSIPEDLGICILDPTTISEHAVVIRRNYSFLIETLDFENNLLEFLFQNEVLSQREYEQISRERVRFRKSEILLSLISRKSDNDFQLFKEALRDANLGFILEELGICLPEKQAIALAEDKHEDEPIRERGNHNPEPIGQTVSQIETKLTKQTVIKSLNRTSEETLIKQEKSVTHWLTKCHSFHDDLQYEIFIKKTILQKQVVQSNEPIHFGENQENMEHQLSRMQREAEKDAFNNARVEWEKENENLIESLQKSELNMCREKESSEKLRMEWKEEKEKYVDSLQNYEKTLKREKESDDKLRMEWEKEKEKHIESLQKSEIILKREKESSDKLRMEWEKEKEKHIESLQKSEKTLKREKESSEKLVMEWEKEKEKHIESLQKSEINLKREKESSDKLRMEWEKEKEKLFKSLKNSEVILKRERESSDKLRMEWEKEKDKLFESLKNSEVILKRERESSDKLRMEWEKEKEKLFESFKNSEVILKRERESSDKLRMEWEKEKEKLVESLHKSEIELKKENESFKKLLIDMEKLQQMAAGLSNLMDVLENNLHKTRQFLKECIDPDFGLIDVLHSRRILSREDMLNINAQETYVMRNSLLLDIISKKKNVLELCVALKEEGQQHVVNYIKASGERSPQFDDDDDWPLTEEEKSKLEYYFKGFAYKPILDTPDLADCLYSRGVINKRHVEFVSSKFTPFEKRKALLEILKRRSIRSYHEAIKCLPETIRRRSLCRDMKRRMDWHKLTSDE